VLADGVEVDYEELGAHVASAAAELGPGRKLVLVEGGNTLETLVSYLGALQGGHPVLLTPPSRLGRLVDAYDPDVVVRGDGRGAAMEHRRVRSRHTLHPDLALLLSTSGSTGSPRLVRLSRQNLEANAASIVEYLRLTPADRAMTSLPMHYCYGLSVIHSHLQVGAGLVLTEASVVDPCFWDLFRSAGATSLAGVPHTFELLDRVEFAEKDLPSLRYVTQAGGRLAPEHVQRYAALGAPRGWELFVMYGQTEATARMGYLPPDLAATHPAAIGVPVPGGSFAIEPVAGSGPDEGELVYQGANVMLGYAEGPADLALGATIGALRTGDLARRGPDGIYEIIGRRSRFVKLFGLRIDLDEVERWLAVDGVEAMCAGDDDRLVVGVVGEHDGAARRGALAAHLGIPRGSVHFRHLGELPRLANGKRDYAALAGRGPEAADDRAVQRHDHVRTLFASVLGAADLTDADSFVSAGGDSLAYVEVSIALEERLGTLPEGWHLMPMSQLEAEPRRRSRFARMEVGVLMRAVAIVVIVANHAGVLDVAGTAHVLLGVAGYNFARFQLASGRLLRSILRIAIPSILVIGVAAATRDDFDLTHTLLVRGPFGDDGDRWGYWFVEALVHLLVGLGLLLAVPSIARLQRRRPFLVALGVVGIGLAVRFDALGLPEPEHAIFRAHELLWIFGIGWAAALAASGRQRLLVSVAALVAAPTFFHDPARNAVLLLGLLVLVWARMAPVPAVLHRVIGSLAGASLFIYLVHWQVLPLVRGLPRAAAVAAAVAAGVLVARVARVATPRVEGWLSAAQLVTRMRWLAKAPMPMCRPAISTVVVPSGEAAVIVPVRPGTTSASSRNSSRPGANSSSSGMRVTVNPPPTSISLRGRVSGAT
jgi:acyl-CoA synthetase (AMP-forming)/AMP-acid ligase II